jgi:hypothetical protein
MNGIRMLYIGFSPEIVFLKENPRVNGEYVLVTGENGLQWFCPRDKLVLLTPLMEALL